MPANSARQPHCGARLCMCMYLRLHSACMCRICCTCHICCMRRQRRWPRGNAAAHAWRAVYRQTTTSLLPTSGLRRSLPCMALHMAMPAGAACVPATCTRHAQKLAQPHLSAPLAQCHLISANTHPAGRSPIWRCMIGPCACIGSNLLRDAMPCLAHACASAATRLAPSIRNPLNHLGQPGVYCQCFQRCQRQSARAPVRPACMSMLRPFANVRPSCPPSRINTGFPERCKPAAASRICASQFQRMVST